MGLGGILCLALGVRMPGEAMTTSFDVEVLEAAASMQARFVAIAYLLSMVICYAFLFIYFRLRKMPLKECVYTRFSVSPIRLLTGYVLMWFVSIAVEPLSSLLPGDQDALGGGGWLLISAVLLAPLFEESIFRGYLGGVLRKSYGGLAAWIISAVVFGVVHAIPSVILTATLSGLVLGYYYFRTRSLWMVIALHALNNLTACFLRMIDMGDVPVREMLGGGALYWGVYALCTLVAMVSLVSMGRYIKRIKSDNNSLK
jgi:membrane protease YdiL (CAAX protease family)